jgi:TRAP-type mannitol/chloroaromatic compound transport system substrate-binding protein
MSLQFNLDNQLLRFLKLVVEIEKRQTINQNDQCQNLFRDACRALTFDMFMKRSDPDYHRIFSQLLDRFICQLKRLSKSDTLVFDHLYRQLVNFKKDFINIFQSRHNSFKGEWVYNDFETVSYQNKKLSENFEHLLQRDLYEKLLNVCYCHFYCEFYCS